MDNNILLACPGARRYERAVNQPANKHPKPAPFSRRQFLAATALAAGGFALTSCASQPRPRRVSANEKLNIACIGAGGKGISDTDHCAGENIVAICDVDETRAAPQLKKHAGAKFYRDWRVLLEREKTVDAVVISTPDHTHAVIASAAIKLGKHVFCQKPLTQTVHEARYLRTLAAEYGVATQMGNQGSAAEGLRRTVEVIQAGLIGPVREVHVWSNRPVWPQALNRPPGADDIPASLDWDGWLGPAPQRPYKNGVYHAFNWRGWFDFGTGALGDMACHTANMPFRALKLGYPTSVELLECSQKFAETYPKSAKIKFAFPAREGLPAVDFFWYDGNPRDKAVQPFRPQPDITRDVAALLETVPDSGCLLIGDRGQIFSPDDYGKRFFLKLKDEGEFKEGRTHEAVREVPRTIPRNTLATDDGLAHHLEWIAACKGGPEAYSNFNTAAALTEIILLGCIALRVGRKLEWDGPNMRAKNAPEAAAFVRREYRAGWKLS